MIPLASDLLPFPGQIRREGHLKSVSLPDRLSSSDRIAILVYFSEVSSRATSSVNKSSLVWQSSHTRNARGGGCRSSPAAVAAPRPDLNYGLGESDRLHFAFLSNN